MTVMFKTRIAIYMLLSLKVLKKYRIPSQIKKGELHKDCQNQTISFEITLEYLFCSILYLTMRGIYHISNSPENLD